MLSLPGGGDSTAPGKRQLDMSALAPVVLPSLVQIMTMAQRDVQNQSYRFATLMENTGITLGRLGLVCPQIVGAQLRQFIKPWCMALRNIRDNEEKIQAFQGICQVISANPHGAAPHFVYFCDAVCSWKVELTPPELHQSFHQILRSFSESANASVCSFARPALPILLVTSLVSFTSCADVYSITNRYALSVVMGLAVRAGPWQVGRVLRHPTSSAPGATS